MKKEAIEIIIESGIEYLYDKLSDFPENCLFHKGPTQCGGTYIALNNKEHYVIAVPYTALAEAKVKVHNEEEDKKYKNDKSYKKNKALLFVGGVAPEELTKYLSGNVERKKVVATYDYLPRFIETLNDCKIFGVGDFSLLVDEYHLLLTQYNFRRSAISNLLNGNGYSSCSYKHFKKYCFMTSTPLDEELIPDELENEQIYYCNWLDRQPINYKTKECEHGVEHGTVSLIKRFLNGNIEGNAYIFVNSLDFIARMVNTCKLDNTNTRGIWSKHNRGATLKKMGINRGTTYDKPKKINFLTSTAFEGHTIDDPEGRIFIICDNKLDHTKLDISTSVVQIAGRIKNSRYNGEVEHLWNPNTLKNYRGISPIDFKKKMLKTLEDARNKVKEYNSLTKHAREKIQVNDKFIAKAGNKEEGFEFFALPNIVKNEIYNYKVVNGIYLEGMSVKREATRAGLNYIQAEKNTDKHMIFKDLDSLGSSFSDVIKELEEKATTYSTNHFIFKATLENAALRYWFIPKAIEILGFEGIRKEKFNITNIKKKLITQDNNVDFDNKVMAILERKVFPGEEYTLGEAKKVLKGVYDALESNKTPKGIDLARYFEVKDDRLISVKRAGVSTKIYHIERAKHTFTDDIRKEEVEHPKDDLPEIEMFDIEPSPKENNIALVQNKPAEDALKDFDSNTINKVERSPEEMEDTRVELSVLLNKELSLDQSEKIYNSKHYVDILLTGMFPKKVKKQWYEEMKFVSSDEEIINEQEEIDTRKRDGYYDY